MKIPLKEWLSSIPGALGIRLEPEPAHTVSRDDGAFQLRQYDPMVWAQTTVEGSREDAANEGFRRLAHYIFGGNRDGIKMSMTTPVVLAEGNDARWTVSFVLPEEYESQAAPKPLNPDVRVNPISTKTLAVYRFSGNPNNENRTAAEEKLRSWIRKQNLRATGEIFWAQYDQPFALPFMKRNEAMIEVAPMT